MKFRPGRIELTISPLCFIITAALFVIDKSGIMSVSVICSLVHELSHIAMMNLMRCPPRRIEIKPYGMLIEGGPCGDLSACVTAAAGPTANLAFAAVCFALFEYNGEYFFVLTAVVNLMIALINILPVRGLDGGEILEVILKRAAGDEKGKRIFSVISYGFALVCSVLGLWLLIIKGNITLALMSLYLLLLNLYKF